MFRRRQPETVQEIDEEIVVLTQRFTGNADVFDAELARIRVDELLERRKLMTDTDEPPAAA